MQTIPHPVAAPPVPRSNAARIDQQPSFFFLLSEPGELQPERGIGSQKQLLLVIALRIGGIAPLLPAREQRSCTSLRCSILNWLCLLAGDPTCRYRLYAIS